jgi:tripartite motif-containing protein 71
LDARCISTTSADGAREWRSGAAAVVARIRDVDGAFLTTWGSSGSGNGQFSLPEGVATDGSGHVYVADTNNDRIQKFDASGTFLTTWGSVGSGNGQFDSPIGVATDGSGNVYVADTFNHRIQKFACP